jgi:hemerythrin-like domain-containing protein
MDAKKAAADRSATAMLKADHQRVRQLVVQYNALAESDSADDDQKRMLAERICQELDVHARLEEELFYPAVRERGHIEGLMDEAEVEHQTARDLIHQIEAMSPGDPLYDAKVKVLGEYVDHHVEEEEKQMMPKARKAGIDEADLARRMGERRKQLEAEQSMLPFEALASMLTMPIRAAAAAVRAGTAARRRAADASSARSASPSAARGTARKAAGTAPRKAAGTTARKAADTTARKVAGAASRPAASSGRTAAGASASKGTRSATGPSGRTGGRPGSKTAARPDSGGRSAARPAAKAATRGSAGTGAKAGTKAASKSASKAGAKAGSKSAAGIQRGRAAR